MVEDPWKSDTGNRNAKFSPFSATIRLDARDRYCNFEEPLEGEKAMRVILPSNVR